jgi:hypothetical protein
VTVLLVYRNTTPEAMEWAEDFKARATSINEARHKWMETFYDLYKVPEYARGAFVRGEEFTGITWPEDMPLPTRWFRPVAIPQLIRPRGNARALIAEMKAFNAPDVRAELREHLGMPSYILVRERFLSCGVRLEDDGVWVTWGAREVADQPEMADISGQGWERVVLSAFIERFGEEEL